MELSAQQIAAHLGGEVEGDPNVKVNTVCRIEEGHTGALTFLSNPRYEQYVAKTEASAVLVSRDFKAPAKYLTTLIRVDDPYRSLAKLLTMVEKKPERKGIEANAFVHEEAELGEDVYVGASSYISKNAKIGNHVKIFPQVYISEDVEIGDHTWIYAGARIHNHSIIGSHCILHCGVVIGGDGFGFAPGQDLGYSKIPQIGNVIIEDRVEIGSNTTIDRATIGSTIIRKGVKLDNLIQIAHNVEIGEDTVIAAQTGISGSTKIGKKCMIGGQVGIIGHISIADGTKIAAQSGIGASITKPNTAVQGSPAFDIIPYQRSYVIFKKLPELHERLNKIEAYRMTDDTDQQG